MRASMVQFQLPGLNPRVALPVFPPPVVPMAGALACMSRGLRLGPLFSMRLAIMIQFMARIEVSRPVVGGAPTPPPALKIFTPSPPPCDLSGELATNPKAASYSHPCALLGQVTEPT